MPIIDQMNNPMQGEIMRLLRGGVPTPPPAPAAPSPMDIARAGFRANIENGTVGGQLEAARLADMNAAQVGYENQRAQFNDTLVMAEMMAQQGDPNASVVIDAFNSMTEGMDPQTRAQVWGDLEALPYDVNAANAYGAVSEVIRLGGYNVAADPGQIKTVTTAEGVFVLNPDGTLGNRLGSPTSQGGTHVEFNPRIEMPGDDKLSTELGKGYAGQILAVGSAANTAMSNLTQLAQLDGLRAQYEQAGGVTGALAPLATQVGELAASFNIEGDLSTAAGLAQAMNSITNEMVLGRIGTSEGEGGMPANNFSNADLNFIVAIPNNYRDLDNAWIAKAEIARRMSERQIEKADMWYNFQRANPTMPEMQRWEEFSRLWRDHVMSNPLIDDAFRSQYGPEALRAATTTPPPATGDGNSTIIKYDADGNRIE